MLSFDRKICIIKKELILLGVSDFRGDIWSFGINLVYLNCNLKNEFILIFLKLNLNNLMCQKLNFLHS